MPRLKLANNAGSVLNGAIETTEDTDITVLDASSFPEAPFRATIYVNGPETGEIVNVTAVAGNVLSIERAQEDTAASTWIDGAKVAVLWTAGAYDELLCNEHAENLLPHRLKDEDEDTEYHYGFVIEDGILNLVYEEVS